MPAWKPQAGASRERSERCPLERGVGPRSARDTPSSLNSRPVDAARSAASMSLLTGAAPCCPSNHPQQSMARSPVQQPVRLVVKCWVTKNTATQQPTRLGDNIRFKIKSIVSCPPCTKEISIIGLSTLIVMNLFFTPCINSIGVTLKYHNSVLRPSN